jgi:hypothetical protein
MRALKPLAVDLTLWLLWMLVAFRIPSKLYLLPLFMAVMFIYYFVKDLLELSGKE